MKEGDIPQDDGACYEGQFRKVQFGVAEDGSYQGVPSKGWEAEIGATSVSTERTNERIHAAWKEVQAGTMAPLGYHMTAGLLDAGHLAMELGTWGWRVRRHLRPKVWTRLSASWKASYAKVLGMTVEALEQIPDEPEQVG